MIWITNALASKLLARKDGNLVGRHDYEPFGAEQGSPAFNSPFRFAGELYNPSHKLYKIGARWYDPKLGRWTQLDLIEQVKDPVEANRYQYAAQDPVNNTDPTGLQAWYNEEGQYCETVIAEAPSDKWDYMYTSACGPPPFTAVPFSSPTAGSFAASCLFGAVNPIGVCKRSVFVHPFISPLINPEPAY